MTRFRFGYRYYLNALALAAGLVVLVLWRSRDPGAAFLTALKIIPLALLTEWLEVRMEPSGSFTLTPILLFTVLLLEGLEPTILVAAGAILGISTFTAKGSWQEMVDSIAREVLSAAAFWVAFTLLGGEPGKTRWVERTLPFLAGSLVYLGVRTTLTALRFYFLEGINIPWMWRKLLAQSSGHHLIITLAALAVAYLYADLGYFTLALATGAIVETYYPWKLLGEQKGVLFTGLRMIAAAVDAKDPYTYSHSQRVAYYAVRLARALGLPEDEVERIRIGALLHDIGKIGVSGRIIRKPARLEEREMQVMKTHSTLSANIMAPIRILGEAAEMVRYHHEHWDGSGYPSGLRGEEIPLGSRIILVADALDALVSDRPYRRGRTKEEAMQILRENAGRQFDPKVVEALASIIHVL